MLNLLSAAASALPMCYIVVAIDAPNPVAVLNHEMAHCWGWIHPEGVKDNSKITKNFKAFEVPLKYKLKGIYPNVDLQYKYSKRVLELCNNMSAYGCAYEGLMK